MKLNIALIVTVALAIKFDNPFVDSYTDYKISIKRIYLILLTYKTPMQLSSQKPKLPNTCLTGHNPIYCMACNGKLSSSILNTCYFIMTN